MKEKITSEVLASLSQLGLKDQLEVLANVMAYTAVPYILEKDEVYPDNWDKFYAFVVKHKSQDNLALALLKQALTINVWLQTSNK